MIVFREMQNICGFDADGNRTRAQAADIRGYAATHACHRGQTEQEEKADHARRSTAKCNSGFRREVWLFLKHEESGSGLGGLSRAYELFSAGLVIYLVVMDIILSIPSLEFMKDASAISTFEFCIYALFTTEYLSLLWSCMADDELYKLGAFKGRLKIASELMNMVDFLVCSAYYITFIPGSKFLAGMGALRMIRLMRVGALMKLEKKTNSISKIGRVFITKKKELLSTAFMASVLMVVSATVMFHIEYNAQPVAFGSIPAALWWSVTALTTVGYGDVCPITPMGKLIASLFAFFGVGIFALPAGILGEGFMEAMQEETDSEVKLMRVKIDEDMRFQVQEAEMMKGEVDGLLETAVRVQKRQQQILELLAALKPEFTAELNDLPLENTAPITSTRPLEVFEWALAACSNNEVLRDIQTRELASLQEHVQQRLSWLKARNGQSPPVQLCT